MNKAEGLRRTGVILNMLGWLAIGGTAAFVGLVFFFYGELESLQIGVVLLPLLGLLLVGSAYILKGFNGPKPE